jgi:phage/plasmid primase-like uncharacterized protein
VLLHCFAGCSYEAVTDALRSMNLWAQRGEKVDRPLIKPRAWSTPEPAEDRDALARTRVARSIWEKAEPIGGTPAEQYLRRRGITCSLPGKLRYVPFLGHPTGTDHPALVAAIQDPTGRLTAVQRIYLTDDGRKAEIPGAQVKLTLGPMHDGAVRLARPMQTLGLAEGVETALSARQLYSLPVWATLSAQRLSKIEMPECVECVAIFADNGEVGQREAAKAAQHYESAGYIVEMISPPDGFGDFNDVLQGKKLPK